MYNLKKNIFFNIICFFYFAYISLDYWKKYKISEVFLSDTVYILQILFFFFNIVHLFYYAHISLDYWKKYKIWGVFLSDTVHILQILFFNIVHFFLILIFQ